MFVKNALKTVFLVCSSLIGAGFASGREIIEFFPPGKGLITSLLSVALISLSIYLIPDFSDVICINPLYKLTVCLFSFCVISVMISASGEFLPMGRFIMSFLVFSTLIFGIRGVENVSLILCPAMILFILIFGLERIWGIKFYELEFGNITQSFLYAGYNIIILPTLLKKATYSKGITASLVFIIMGSLILIVYFASSLFPYDTMPFVSAVGSNAITVAIILMALYTTAVCSGFCICDVFHISPRICFITVFLSYILSYSGFGNLISIGYRTFGITGVFIIIYGMFQKKKAL